MSRSGPNMTPPKINAAATVVEEDTLWVAAYVAAKAGKASRIVIASWVLPLGTETILPSSNEFCVLC